MSILYESKFLVMCNICELYHWYIVSIEKSQLPFEKFLINEFYYDSFSIKIIYEKLYTFGHKFPNVIFDVQITVSRRFILVMRRNILRTRESLLLFLLFIRFRYVQITTGHWYRMQVNKRGDVLWRRKLEQFHPDFTIFFPPLSPIEKLFHEPVAFFPLFPT